MKFHLKEIQFKQLECNRIFTGKTLSPHELLTVIADFESVGANVPARYLNRRHPARLAEIRPPPADRAKDFRLPLAQALRAMGVITTTTTTTTTTMVISCDITISFLKKAKLDRLRGKIP